MKATRRSPLGRALALSKLENARRQPGQNLVSWCLQGLVPNACISLGVALLLSSLFAGSVLEADRHTTAAAVLPLVLCAVAAALWVPMCAAPARVRALPEWLALSALATPPVVLNLAPPIALALLENEPGLSRHEAYCILLSVVFSALPGPPLDTPAIATGTLAFVILASRTVSDNANGTDVALLGVGAVAVPLVRRISHIASSSLRKPLDFDVTATACGKATRVESYHAIAQQSPRPPQRAIVLDLAKLSSAPSTLAFGRMTVLLCLHNPATHRARSALGPIPCRPAPYAITAPAHPSPAGPGPCPNPLPF